MQRILKFIKNFKEYFLFIVLVILSLLLISVGDVTKLNGFRSIIISTVGWLQEAFDWLPDTGALETENKALRELNLQLSTEVTNMRTAVIENNKLRKLIGFKTQVEYQVVSAEVVGRTNVEMRNYYTINKGENDSITVGMCVRSDAGLVGVIVATSDNYSLVELIRNKNVNISSLVQRSRYSGILNWEGGPYFNLKNIPKSFDVVVGDTIVTSNYSSKYPKDIPIGYVVNVEELPGDIYKKISIKPFVNFETLEQVFIIKYIPDMERVKLIEKILDRMKLRKSAVK